MQMSGFVNSARLTLANIGLAGNKLEELIAGLNPDAAVAVGREERSRLLKVAAEKLAEQRQILGRKEVELKTSTDDLKVKKAAAQTITSRAQSGGQLPSEKATAELVATMKRVQNNVERLEAEIVGIRTAVSLLESMVDQRAEALRSFDSEAENVKHRLDMAKLRKDQADLQAEVSGLGAVNASTVGLSALARAADKAEQQASAAEIVHGATSSQLQGDSVMADILAEAKTGHAKKSPLDELAELSK